MTGGRRPPPVRMEPEGSIQVFWKGELKEGCCAADFIADDDERFAVGAFLLVDEDDAFGAEIAAFTQCRRFGEVTIVEVPDKHGCEWVGNVVNHYATNAFQTN